MYIAHVKVSLAKAKHQVIIWLSWSRSETSERDFSLLDFPTQRWGY